MKLLEQSTPLILPFTITVAVLAVNVLFCPLGVIVRVPLDELIALVTVNQLLEEPVTLTVISLAVIQLEANENVAVLDVVSFQFH
jgi:hypothetical protein